MSRHTAFPNRRGFTISEIIVAMILLGSVIAMLVPLTKRAIDQRRAVETRRAALIEVSNALERVTADASAWPEPGTVQSAPLPDAFAGRLREARLEITSVPLDESPPGRRFDATLTWLEPTGRHAAPLRLSAFAFEGPSAEGGTP